MWELHKRDSHNALDFRHFQIAEASSVLANAGSEIQVAKKVQV